jgi:hypothetical protein
MSSRSLLLFIAVATIPALSIPRRASTLPSDSEPLSNWCTTSTGASSGRERGFQTLVRSSVHILCMDPRRSTDAATKWSASGISKSATAKIQGSVRLLSRIVGLVRNLASSVSKSSTWCAFLGKIPSDCHDPNSFPEQLEDQGNHRSEDHRFRGTVLRVV